MQTQRSKRRQMSGIVLSDKMDKTVVVGCTQRLRHKLYNRVVTRHTKYKVHNPENKAKTGDRVKIVETRPLSKEKKWRIAEIQKKEVI